jgi:hypothetical protein
MSASGSPFARLHDSAAFQALERVATARSERLGVTGLHGPARALVLTLLLAKRRTRALVVVPDDARLSDWSRDFAAAAAPHRTGTPRGILLFPALDADPLRRHHRLTRRSHVSASGRSAVSRGERWTCCSSRHGPC